MYTFATKGKGDMAEPCMLLWPWFVVASPVLALMVVVWVPMKGVEVFSKWLAGRG